MLCGRLRARAHLEEAKERRLEAGGDELREEGTGVRLDGPKLQAKHDGDYPQLVACTAAREPQCGSRVVQIEPSRTFVHAHIIRHEADEAVQGDGEVHADAADDNLRAGRG